MTERTYSANIRPTLSGSTYANDRQYSRYSFEFNIDSDQGGGVIRYLFTKSVIRLDRSRTRISSSEYEWFLTSVTNIRFFTNSHSSFIRTQPINGTTYTHSFLNISSRTPFASYIVTSPGRASSVSSESLSITFDDGTIESGVYIGTRQITASNYGRRPMVIYVGDKQVI